ncbi:hypothetical protein ACF0H5_011141 [Mactra antiquata]
MTTTTTETIEVVSAVELGPINITLIALSGTLGIALIMGVGFIIYKEYRRTVRAKVMDLKQKLTIRRKGISGESTMRRGTSSESISISENTSYIQLTETPSSIRCSSAWTPSPVTRISVSDTPTSGNFSL